MALPDEVIKKFWDSVEPNGDECWEWPRGRGSHGYGVMYGPKRTQYLAHRVALQIREEPPSPGLHALHSCDNKICVNPEHLRWGTHAENLAEAADRGLMKPGRVLGKTCPKGHEYTDANTIVTIRKEKNGRSYTCHRCRECNRLYSQARRDRRMKERTQ